ncbi:malonyl-CoA decarboxylase [Limnohabitans radicicola]|uniref:Malonyl-CoA decarboxylase n=1 Tax=Limnohabitans radicicola TaxID=2771427 RepID=A0A927FH59_9BURK|nr:malonyl-CoA decarboxylase [Limnohabitans radicicola]MBD8050896.1 malonyl-CoA decarboxylase [Limnohabitans radicicola]
MNTSEWIGRKVAGWLPTGKREGGASVSAAEGKPDGRAAKPAASKEAQVRSSRERLNATLRQKEEALSPRVLRRTLTELQAIVDPSVSEVEGGKRARGVAQWYTKATPEQRQDCWLLMSEQFAPDASKVKAAREQYEAAVGTPDEGVAEIRLRKALVSPRTRLLQRFAAFPEGMRFLVDLRQELMPALKSNKRLLALEAELENLFTTWFDVAFLELRRISWDSPASLVEKLIKYEAVHDIKSWGDVKNRLDSDRRCYGFFHPRLPDEPLIFVEVAFMDEIAASITPLLDEAAEAVDLSRATTAIFYSISNTQQGLKGVSFGDSLIKRVVETLRADFPKLKTFATLSPIPGFRAWLNKNAERMLEATPEKVRTQLGRAVGFEPVTAGHVLSALDQVPTLPERSALRQWLLACAAHYLGKELSDERPADPVARFHLGNGARVEQINWAADLSSKGIKQSFGLMVNYLYDLRRLDRHRQGLAQGRVPVSDGVERLYF